MCWRSNVDKKTIYRNNHIRLTNSEILEITKKDEREVFVERGYNCLIISQDKELIKDLKASSTAYMMLTFIDKKIQKLDKKADKKIKGYLKRLFSNKENYLEIEEKKHSA